MLDDLGPQIYTCLGRANSLEVNRGAGSSMSLVDDQNVYRFAADSLFSFTWAKLASQWIKTCQLEGNLSLLICPELLSTNICL